ncbi:unnamed protein product [Cochlearia groenlandica]
MQENCGDCMRWEEELYWTHFKTLHFSQLLLPGFNNHLAIPQKFSTHCKGKLANVVTLKSPSGVTYNVGLEENDEKTLSFSCGWDKFVKDHSLQENDLLVFKFNGNSEFEVLVFDGDTLCEKPTSYFVKICGHADKNKGIDLTATTSSRSPKRRTKLDHHDDDVECGLNQQHVISPVGNDLEDLIDIDIDTDTPRLVVSQTGFQQEEHNKSEIDTESGQLPVISSSSKGRIDVEMISSKSVPEIYKRKALSQARRAVSPNGLLIVMKRSHVLSKCFLTIPKKWCKENMSFEPQEVVMQVNQTKWRMSFNIYLTRGRGGISTGWRKFVHDNNLRIGDVSVFEPVKTETKLFHLNVRIFRATEEENTNND